MLTSSLKMRSEVGSQMSEVGSRKSVTDKTSDLEKKKPSMARKSKDGVETIFTAFQVFTEI